MDRPDYTTPEATVHITDRNGIRVGEVVGEIDVSNAHLVLDILRNASDGQLAFILSLENCGFCDSHGLSALIALGRQFGRTMVIALPQTSMLRKVFTTMAIEKIIRIEDSVDLAYERLTGRETVPAW